MSQPSESDPAEGPHEQEFLIGEESGELPVLAGPPRIAGVRPLREALPSSKRASSVRPAVQAAAVAAGSFVAGAAVVTLVHRHQQRSPALRGGTRGGRALARGGVRATAGLPGELVQVLGTRRFLVDVHTLGPGSER